MEIYQLYASSTHSLYPTVIGDVVVVPQLNAHGVCCITIEAIIANGAPLTVAVDLNHSSIYVATSVETDLAGVRIVPNPGSIYKDTS